MPAGFSLSCFRSGEITSIVIGVSDVFITFVIDISKTSASLVLPPTALTGKELLGRSCVNVTTAAAGSSVFISPD
jgi:hypothetical protein